MEIWFRLIYLLSAFGVLVSIIKMYSNKCTITMYNPFLVLLCKLVKKISSGRLVV